jgi:hypothetical protein
VYFGACWHFDYTPCPKSARLQQAETGYGPAGAREPALPVSILPIAGFSQRCNRFSDVAVSLLRLASRLEWRK